MSEKSEKKAKALMVYSNWCTLFDGLPDDQAIKMFRAMLDYFFRDKDTDFQDEMSNAVFTMIKNKIQEDKDHYIETCKKRAEAGKKGAETKQANANDNKQDIANASNCQQNLPNLANTNTNTNTNTNNILINNNNKDKERECEREEEKKTKESKPKRFVPPTLDEVKAYCQERNNNVIPEKFIDYYESNGWKVGRNPMKDWKACVRSWEGNCYNKAPPKYQPCGISQALADIHEPIIDIPAETKQWDDNEIKRLE